MIILGACVGQKAFGNKEKNFIFIFHTLMADNEIIKIYRSFSNIDIRLTDVNCSNNQIKASLFQVLEDSLVSVESVKSVFSR